jgi:geranylgeranyl reductase family protein
LIYDAIIVGAGPAGSVTAFHLARRGLRVLIIEKASLPRYKACGGGLTSKALRNLPFDVGPVVELQAIGGMLTYQGRLILKVDTARPIASLVRRDLFDRYLASKAVEAGATLYDGLAYTGYEEQEDLITAITSQGNYSGRVLVGADGVRSRVARQAGLLPEREIGVALEAELAVPGSGLSEQGFYATFDFGALPYGYGWVFPKRDHLSAGVFHARPGKDALLRDYLKSFIDSQEVLAHNETVNLRGHHIPLGGHPQALHKERLLLVGDAANLADPWLGEGLYYAILSGMLAADAITQALEADSLDLSAYTLRVNDEIVRDFGYARIFAWLVYHLPRLGTFLMQKSETLQDIVFGVMRGDITFEELVGRLVGGLPNILIQVLNPAKSAPVYRSQS